MSGNCKGLLFLLQRCVAVRPSGPAAIIRRSVSSNPWSFIQHQRWTSGGPQRLCPLQSAVRSNHHRFSTQAGPPCEDEYPPLPAYQLDSEPETKEVYLVQVKGLPWSCTAQDLLQFFSDCRIHAGEKGIHLIEDRPGRPSGRAFIEMEHEQDVIRALGKHRQYLGSRYVEVFEVTDSDAEAILKKPSDTRADNAVVLLRGLPFSCKEDDIINFFSGLDIAEGGITIVADNRGKNSGDAFVQFSSVEEANKALQRDREFIGHRYIEVFPSSRSQIHSSWRMRGSLNSSQQDRRTISPPQTNTKAVPPEMSDVPYHYLHLRGLPFQVSGEDIVKFFSPLKVSKILLECGPDGRLSGEADVYFSSHEDAVTAMSRDRLKIGHRYIELFLNSGSDLD
uniref:G-rich RNA sequence binding factor 1 n=1 Tax=Nothobranchius kuhntae TaxID=321403 RepID=A0A1A8KZS8_NOTKU